MQENGIDSRCWTHAFFSYDKYWITSSQTSSLSGPNPPPPTSIGTLRLQLAEGFAIQVQDSNFELVFSFLTRRPQAERVSAEGANLVNLSPNCKKCAPLTSEKTTKNCSPPLTPADHNQSKQSSHTCLGHPLSCQKSGDTTPLAISDLEIGQKGFSAVAQQWRRVHFLSSCSSFSFL